MNLRSKWWLVPIVTASVLGAAYANRLHLLQYSLGWYTDLRYPRDAPKPVPWMQGPASAEKPLPQRPPNVIVILADDMGINDVSTYGAGWSGQGVSTPNIDAIARDGVRFENGYAASAVSTVSRAALMTGRYPWRFGVEFTPTPGAMARVAGALYAKTDQLRPVQIDQDLAKTVKDFNDLGMPPSEQTVAESLKTRGYHTLHIGKWHLGSTPEMRPNNQGFDETLFMESGLHLPENSPDVVNAKQDFDPIDRFLWPNMRFGVSYNGGKWFEPAKYLADYYTDEAVEAIKRNKNRPFFMYLAHWGVHSPLQASKADYDALPQITSHRERVYAAMVRSIDRSVGRVVQTLKEQGLEDNTLVIFTSDNGAPGYIGIPSVNRPYRGWKLTFFEGGLRVPFVAKWPGHLAPGGHYPAPVSHIDVMPTVVAAAGGTMPGDRPTDGVNLLPYLVPNSGATPPLSSAARPSLAKTTAPPMAAPTQPDRLLFWRDGPYRAVRDAKWKLIESQLPRKDWLFDLQADPTERVNLADKEPARLAELKAALQTHHAGMPAPLWPSFIQVPIAIDKTLDQAWAREDEYTYWSN